MSETLRFHVTVVINRALLLLRAIVPGELQQTLPLRDRVGGTLSLLRVGTRVAQEVKVESSILVLNGAQQSHSKDFLVVLDASLGALDTEHGVVQAVGGGIGGGANILIVTADNLDPVSIGILDKRDVTHTALGKLLLEGVSGILQSLAGSFDVVHRDSNVSETAVGLSVTVDHAVVGVILRAMVMGELQDAVAVGEVTVTLERLRAIVGKEVEGELVLGEVDLVNLVETQVLVEFH